MLVASIEIAHLKKGHWLAAVFIYYSKFLMTQTKLDLEVLIVAFKFKWFPVNLMTGTQESTVRILAVRNGHTKIGKFWKGFSRLLTGGGKTYISELAKPPPHHAIIQKYKFHIFMICELFRRGLKHSIKVSGAFSVPTHLTLSLFLIASLRYIFIWSLSPLTFTETPQRKT